MRYQVHPRLLKPAAKKGNHRSNIPDMERQALTDRTRLAGSKDPALMQIGHMENGFQHRTGAGFKRSQIKSAARASVKIENRYSSGPAPLDAQVEANAIIRGHIAVFRKLHVPAYPFFHDCRFTPLQVNHNAIHIIQSTRKGMLCPRLTREIW